MAVQCQFPQLPVEVLVQDGLLGLDPGRQVGEQLVPERGRDGRRGKRLKAIARRRPVQDAAVAARAGCLDLILNSVIVITHCV